MVWPVKGGPSGFIHCVVVHRDDDAIVAVPLLHGNRLVGVIEMAAFRAFSETELKFLEVAREVTRRKPVVLLKSGATEAGRQAAMAHTAAMASPDRIVDGMLRQAGVVRILDYTHLILAGKAFSMLPLPTGNGVSFLAPSGAMLATAPISSPPALPPCAYRCSGLV